MKLHFPASACEHMLPSWFCSWEIKTPVRDMLGVTKDSIRDFPVSPEGP